MNTLVSFLDRPRGPAVLLAVAAFTCLATINLLHWPFLFGNSSFWDVPRGSIGHGWADMATALAGYRYFQQDTWRWPLLAVPMLGLPNGTNVTFTDGIPILALVGRLVFRATGIPINLSGLWIALCFMASAISMAMLVRLLGGRSLAAGIVAGVIGFTMPPLLFRWGHPALMAQYEVTLALALYLWRSRSTSAYLAPICTLAMCVFALLTNSYLFLMVGGIIASFYMTAIWRVPTQALWLMPEMAALGGILASVVIGCGLLGPGGSLRTVGYGLFSANLLGPLVPQMSGLVPTMSRLVVDGTGGQYEGFCYLGAGLFMLVVAAMLERKTWRRIGAHPYLTALLCVFAVLSLSNEIFVGPWHVITLPVPSFLLGPLETVRSSGRFVWPPFYAGAAYAVASAAKRPRAAALLVVAACLQWVDTAPLRRIINTEISSPAVQPVQFSALRAAMAGRRSVIVTPSFACLADPPGWSKALALEVELAAASEFVATNTVYQSRHTADCQTEQRDAILPSKSDNTLRIYLPEWSGFNALVASAEPNCAASAQIVICAGNAPRDILIGASEPQMTWKAPMDEPWLEEASREQKR